MEKNMGNIDRIVRLVISALLVYIYFTGIVTGSTGVFLLVIAGVFILTSVFAFCPVYSVLGIRTCASD